MKRVILAAVLVLAVASFAVAQEAPQQKFYARISTTQTLPQRLVEQFRSAARSAGAEAQVMSVRKDGMVGCSALIKVQTQNTVQEIVAMMQKLVLATDVFADSAEFSARIVITKEVPR